MKTILYNVRNSLRYSLKSFPAWGEPRRLFEIKEKIEKKYNVDPQNPENTDLKTLYEKVQLLWKEKGKDGLSELTFKEKKWLPWIIYYGDSPKIIENEELLINVLDLMSEQLYKTLPAAVLVFLRFYDPDMPGTEILRKYIHEQLAAYNKNNYKIKKWKNKAVLLFSKNGPNITADWVLNHRQDILNSLEELGLTGNLSNCNFLKQVIIEALNIISKNISKHLDNLEPLLELHNENSNTTEVRFPELITEAANYILPAADYEAPYEWQEKLRPFFLRHLGDPRLPGGITRWKGVSEHAVSIFKQWLSQKDLDFFFNLVEKSNQDKSWKYRRKFWEAYLGHIENTWIALGSRAERLVSSIEMEEHREARDFGRLKGGSSEQSVFLIEMGGYVFIEWSNSGACRIWKKENFPFRFGAEEYRAESIRFENPDYKLDHRMPDRYYWQDILSEWLWSELKITRLKSYYLD